MAPSIKTAKLAPFKAANQPVLRFPGVRDGQFSKSATYQTLFQSCGSRRSGFRNKKGRPASKRSRPPLDWYIELQSELKIGNSMGTPNGVASVSLRQ